MRAGFCALLSASFLSAAMLLAAPQPPAKVDLEAVLNRAGWYLDYFVDEFENVVAEENYIQDSSQLLPTTSPASGGRGAIAAADTEQSPLVVVISQGLARRAWPDASPIGRKILVGRFPGFAEVVGVAGDVKNNGLAREPMAEMYTPYRQRPWPRMQFAVRSAGGDPNALVNAVRVAVQQADRELPITQVETMDAALADSIATERLMAWLLFAFAAVALLMAAAGLYGVIAYTVTQRTQEIGVRVALGADPQSVVRLVAAEGLRLTAAGMIVGTLAAAAVSRGMRGMLFEVSPADPLTYAAVLALFAATAGAALIVPARRALRVDPLTALRAE